MKALMSFEISQKQRVSLIFLLVSVASILCYSYPAQALTGSFRVAIIRVFYTDETVSMYTDAQVNLAAAEIRNYFNLLSNGNLDVQVSVTKANLQQNKYYYWYPCGEKLDNLCYTRDLDDDAVEAAAAAGFSFANIDGICLLHPFRTVYFTNGGFANGGDHAVGPVEIPVEISGQTVTYTFQLAHDFETEPNTGVHRLLTPPGLSGVWWGPWVHEIGHEIESVNGTYWAGDWTGHPSQYASGYNLMDSCYPCGESAYALSGPPVMNGPRFVFPGWLPSDKVQWVNPPSGTSTTVTLKSLSGYQGSPLALQIPGFDSVDNHHLYYFVQARVRSMADGVLNNGAGIYDEGVQILGVGEYWDPPVINMYSCDARYNVDVQLGDECITDKNDPRKNNCFIPIGPGQGSVPIRWAPPGDPNHLPDYCWPHPLWHTGDLFSSPLGIRILVNGLTDQGYSITIARDTEIPRYADTYILSGDDYQTVDIWIDSSCNGYEEIVGAQGLRYGRQPDGTVIGNGDDPCVNHQNRLFARVRAAGHIPARNVRVKFSVLDPRAIVLGNMDWIPAGVATSAEFPALASLSPGESTEVYVPWTFPVEWDENPALNFLYPTAVTVYIEPVADEPVFLQKDQTAIETFGNLELKFFGDVFEWEFYDPVFWIKNPFVDQINSLPFFVDVLSELPSGWRVELPDDVQNPILLTPGQRMRIPLNIEAPSLVSMEKQTANLFSANSVSETYPVRIKLSTLITTHNEAAPEGSIYEFKRDRKVIGEAVLATHMVLPVNLSLEAFLDAGGDIVSSGFLEPSPGQVIIAIDYTDPSQNITTRLIVTNEDGSYEDSFPALDPGIWSIQTIWQGNGEYSSAISQPVLAEVTDSDGDGIPDGKEPISAKQFTIGALLDQLPSGDSKADHFIEKAIHDIKNSLDSVYWETDSTLREKGKKVFGEEKKACKELMKINDGQDILLETVSKVIESLVEADKILAQTMIDEALDAGGDQKEIDKALKEMDEAQKENDKGKYDKAIEHYKKAWDHAQKAMKEVP